MTQKPAFAFLILSVCFIITGSANTIVAKWIDKITSLNRFGLIAVFNHPYLQSWFMFVGEFACLIVFNLQLMYRRHKGKPIVAGKDIALPSCNRFLFMIPALCDMVGTTLLYIGMTMTHASVAQMLRGSSMIFTAIISLLFLKQRLHAHHWIGMASTVSGLILVGVSSMLLEDKTSDASNPVVGNTCILIAQVIVGTQMVVEEKILTRHKVPPLQTVGWEGFWGLVLMTTLLGIFQAVPHMHSGWLMPDDFIDGVIMITHSPMLKVAVCCAICTIALFNFFGLSITKSASATTRTVLDSIRTLFIWIFGLVAHWQKFQWLQPVGFVFMLLGTALYRGFIRIPGLYYEKEGEDGNDSHAGVVGGEEADDDEEKAVKESLIQSVV